MTIQELMEINKTYELLAIEGNYENELHNEILVISTQAISAWCLVGTMTDRDTFGEYTRRFERYSKEVKELLGRT